MFHCWACAVGCRFWLLPAALSFKISPHTTPLEHEQPTDPASTWHAVHLERNAGKLVWKDEIQVNSTHHQVIDDLGRCTLVGAPDGIVEAIELSELTCVGVQWHPELVDSTIFTAFGQAI